jgi:hypothetical protein
VCSSDLAESSPPKNVAADRDPIESLGLAGEVAPMSPRPGIGPELETLTLLPRPSRRLMFG